MKEEWLMSGAVVPVDVETTAALVAEIHRLIGVVGNMALAQASQEPVGRFAKFTDGVWRPVTDYSAGVPLYTHPPQRTWVGLTRMELIKCGVLPFGMSHELYQAIEAKLKQKNGYAEEKNT